MVLIFRHILAGILSVSFGSLSGQGATSDAWAGLPREASPSLSILWQAGKQTAAKAGPAEILASSTITLSLAGAKAGDEIRWWQLIPDTRQYYKNANHPWEPNAYQWVGFAKIPCLRRELTTFRGKAEAVVWPKSGDPTATLHPLACPEAGEFYHTDCGSFWFVVEIRRAGMILRSAGLEEAGEKGMSPRVFRLSVRKTAGFLGVLSSYCNVPGLFGCVPWQSYHYVGVDCADVLMAAASRRKGTELKRDWNVEMIVGEWPHAAEVDLSGGVLSAKLKWGTDIKPGYLLAVRYSGAKTYQHIGTLAADANENGVLDAPDTVLHAGPQALQYSELGSGSFNGHLVIMRNE